MDLHLSPHHFPKWCHPSICDQIICLFNFTEVPPVHGHRRALRQSVTPLMPTHKSKHTWMTWGALGLCTHFIHGRRLHSEAQGPISTCSDLTGRTGCLSLRRCDAEKGSSWTNRTSTHIQTHTTILSLPCTHTDQSHTTTFWGTVEHTFSANHFQKRTADTAAYRIIQAEVFSKGLCNTACV